jgi:hypothetical protein
MLRRWRSITYETVMPCVGGSARHCDKGGVRHLCLGIARWAALTMRMLLDMASFAYLQHSRKPSYHLHRLENPGLNLQRLLSIQYISAILYVRT